MISINMIPINMKSSLLLASLLLLSLTTSANAFSMGRLAQALVINAHSSGSQSLSSTTTTTSSPLQGMMESSAPYRRLSTRQLIEEDFSTQRIEQGYGITGRVMALVQRVSKRFDTSKMADKGVAFALSYALVSNLNGAVSLSLAWYIACLRVSFVIRTLSDLCPSVSLQTMQNHSLCL
jgi:hypothetical protein